VMPPTRYPTVPVTAVAAFLKQSGVGSALLPPAAPVATATPGAAVAPVLATVVGLQCGP
jgi:hypothetical protein